MAFPDIQKYPQKTPSGPYERQMGSVIVGLLRLFEGRVPDAESYRHVSQLAATPDRWSAAHAVFDEVRHRLLAADKVGDAPRQWQYCFEESCCKTLYNATDATDPFDPSSPFFVAGDALGLAQTVGVPLMLVVAVLAPNTNADTGPA